MIGWLVLAVYVIGYFPAAAWVARAAARDGYPEGALGMMEATLGCTTAIAWPLIVFPFAIKWLATRETPAERRDRLAIERDERVAEMAATIRRLEREAGIK